MSRLFGAHGWAESWNYEFLQEMRHFARCVRGKKECIAPGEDGRVVMQVLCAGYESARRGCKVELPFEPKGIAKPTELWQQSGDR